MEIAKMNTKWLIYKDSKCVIYSSEQGKGVTGQKEHATKWLRKCQKRVTQIGVKAIYFPTRQTQRTWHIQ